VLTLAPAVLLLAAAAAPAAAYEIVPVAGGGALTGRVTFAGTPPRPEPAPAGRDREACGDDTAPAPLVVGPDRGVAGGVVLLEGVRRGKKPDAEVVLEARGCAFTPHVTAAMAGERAQVRSADDVVHNPRGVRARTTVFNLALPHRDDTIDITRRLERAGAVHVVCDAHPRMSGWIVVHDSPYVAVSDAHGAFRIDAIPPGRYRVALWHEGYRRRGRDADGRARYETPRLVTKAVTIAPGATATVDFELK
jgi:plastocyanin